jgi:hypothetical protein
LFHHEGFAIGIEFIGHGRWPRGVLSTVESWNTDAKT